MITTIHNSTSVGESQARNSERQSPLIEVHLTGAGVLSAIVRLFTSIDGVQYNEAGRVFLEGSDVVHTSYNVEGPWYYVDVTKLEGDGARVVVRGD